MSRLSKKSIPLPAGVTCRVESGVLFVAGPKGEERVPVLSFARVEAGPHGITVAREGSEKQARMNEGTMWSLARNAVRGVTEGYKKVLEISGVGYRASLEGKTLVLALGFVHPVRYEPPRGVSVSVEKNQMTVSGTNKELVGRAAAEIRAFKKPEPYKGKGITYQGEVIRRKAGKKATASAAA